MEYRVLLADDQPAARLAVRESLEQEGPFLVCSETASAPEAVRAALELQPDICLLDIRMPGNGIRAAAQISAKLPQTAVVMLTASREDSDLFDALRAGARGYLLKNGPPRQLAHELERVLAGEGALEGTLLARVIEEFRIRSRNRRRTLAGAGSVELTSREWQVLELLADELPTGEIAARMFISKQTVRSHVKNILDKLQVGSRGEAIELFRG